MKMHILKGHMTVTLTIVSDEMNNAVFSTTPGPMSIGWHPLRPDYKYWFGAEWSHVVIVPSAPASQPSAVVTGPQIQQTSSGMEV